MSLFTGAAAAPFSLPDDVGGVFVKTPDEALDCNPVHGVDVEPLSSAEWPS